MSSLIAHSSVPAVLVACLALASTPFATDTGSPGADPAAPRAADLQDRDASGDDEGPERALTDEELASIEKGRDTFRDILVAAGIRADLPGDWRNFVFWRDVAGVRYDELETYSTKLKGPGNPWRINHLLPRFLFADGRGRGYLLQELVVRVDDEGTLGPQFKREVGAGDIYWYEVDGKYDRNEEGVMAAQRSYLGEYFYGLFPHATTLFDPQIRYLRDERSGNRTYEVYRFVVSAPFEAQYGHFARSFNAFVNPRTKRIEQLQFIDPYNEKNTVVVKYTHWVRVDVPPEQRAAFEARIEEDIAGFEGRIGKDSADRLREYVAAHPEVIPSYVVFPSRRIVFDSNGGHEREFLSEDFHLEPLPPEAIEPPWQSGKSFTSPYRSDYFDPDPEESEGGSRSERGAGGSQGGGRSDG
ncbi:MAG: hypothetical protein R3F34_02585 [Planctomycetota bacterium]